MNERLKQQLDFILEIDKEKNILRQTHLSGHGRRENDAEHAWHMAIMAYLLKDYANEPVDIAKDVYKRQPQKSAYRSFLPKRLRKPRLFLVLHSEVLT